MDIAAQRAKSAVFEGLALQADKIAKNYGKTAQIKPPITISGLALVLRNKDENSRDSLLSVNTIQTAMDIAALAAALKMDTVCHIQQDALHLTITPKPQTKGKRK